MRVVLSLILLFWTINSFSQTSFQGSVRDSGTREPLSYCSIAIKGTKKGTITNGEGVFSIPLDLKKDTVLFSYVGYEAQEISASRLFQNKIVFLVRKDVLLQEVAIYASDDFLYEIVDQCRKKLLRNQTVHTSKVYYGIETQTNDQPIEMVECYYNGYLKGTSMDKLLLKNGRIGLAELDNRYFLTLNTSKGISRIDMTVKNEYNPTIPLQYKKRELKKIFTLSLGFEDKDMYNIKFKPRKNDGNHFSGEIWIDRKTSALLKIDFSIDHAARHPFLPLFSCDTLSNVDLKISHTFKQEGNAFILDHINFQYHVTYKSVRDAPKMVMPSIITRDINTSGVMYYYDYDNPFILPYFEYDTDYDDYRKMSIIPYNEVFWNNNNMLLLTERQKESLGFFSHKGCLINFREGNYGKNFLPLPNYDGSLYEFYYSFWSPENRISINRKMDQNEIYPQKRINQNYQTNLYNLKVQILLDVTQLDDSLVCRSYTVFDAKKTFFHLPEDSVTKAFLNIYFDICEIERRKMEKELDSRSCTVMQIDSVYKSTMKKINIITYRYLEEVQLGKKDRAFRKWNGYVIENLGIDNLKLSEKKKNGD
jgi:CarboxypepD_reg-like domain